MGDGKRHGAGFLWPIGLQRSTAGIIPGKFSGTRELKSFPPDFCHTFARRSQHLRCVKHERLGAAASRAGQAVLGGYRAMKCLLVSACLAGLAMSGAGALAAETVSAFT